MSELHQRAAWRRLSAQILKQRPICQDPFGWHAHTGRYAPATEVHHVEPVENAPERLLDTSNLLALCPECHKALHGAQDALMRMLRDGLDANALAQGIAKGGRGV